jgi:DNA invertase Pin-like site-specific DNA recombinase
MKSVALYGRYSSDLQSPTSITDQFALCQAHADRMGWTVVARFEDAALSGFGIEHRAGYQALLAAALSPQPAFDVILVEDTSRLTRDMGELLRLYHRLRLKSVELVGVSDGIATGQQGGKVTLAVKGLVNELYLDDLRDKTHRGLAGCISRGHSAGGRIFGYRTVKVSQVLPPGHGSNSARFEIEPNEAEIIRRIFRDYAAGQSMAMIAHALNRDGVPFPAKDTKRGPARLGWAVSTIHTILRNEKYVGDWVWNKTRFLKDPDSGRRRPVSRPAEEWIRHERPELRVVEPEAWEAVQARLKQIHEQFGEPDSRRPLRNGAGPLYSPYLLSGLLRCACGASMSAQTAKRRKAGKVYVYGWYRCGFARDKGPSVCTHRTWYPQAPLERALIAKFREATTPAMVSTLVQMVNAELDRAQRDAEARAGTQKAELLRLEREAANLVRFLAEGGDSRTVREELRAIEEAIQAVRLEFTSHERRAPLRVHRAWVESQLDHLEDLLRRDACGARAEIRKHLDGMLTVNPLPGPAGARRLEISGRVKHDSLLADQEAVRALVGCGGSQLPMSSVVQRWGRRFTARLHASSRPSPLYRVQAPFARHALEHARSAVRKPDAGAGDEVPYGPRHRHFAGLRLACYTRPDMNGQSANLLSQLFTLAGMEGSARVTRRLLRSVSM